MIKKILTLILVMFSITYSDAQWIQKFYVDDFGDKTTDSYIVYKDSYGTFSNSATENSPLTVQVLISYTAGDTIPEVRFDIYEYGSGPSVGRQIDQCTYGLTIKLSDNSTFTYYLKSSQSTLSMDQSKPYEIVALINSLKKESSSIKCRLSIQGEYTSNIYNFKISPVGFSAALLKIKTN